MWISKEYFLRTNRAQNEDFQGLTENDVLRNIFEELSVFQLWIFKRKIFQELLEHEV